MLRKIVNKRGPVIDSDTYSKKVSSLYTMLGNTGLAEDDGSSDKTVAKCEPPGENRTLRSINSVRSHKSDGYAGFSAAIINQLSEITKSTSPTKEAEFVSLALSSCNIRSCKVSS